MLDAQSHYMSAPGSTHGTEMRSNKPPSAIEERGEKWAGEVRFSLSVQSIASAHLAVFGIYAECCVQRGTDSNFPGP